MTSVKANIGHTETVSGVAGLIKVVLMMQHGLIPPQTHLQKLNPHISLEGTRLVIPAEAGRLARRPQVADRRRQLVRLRRHERPRRGRRRRRDARRPQPALDRPLRRLVASETHPTDKPHPQPARPAAAPVDGVGEERKPALPRLAGRYAEHLGQNPRRLAGRRLLLGQRRPLAFQPPGGRSPGTQHELPRAAAGAGGRQQVPGVQAVRAKLALAADRHALHRPGLAVRRHGPRRCSTRSRCFADASAVRRDPAATTARSRCSRCSIPTRGATSPLDETAYTPAGPVRPGVLAGQLWRSWGIEPGDRAGPQRGRVRGRVRRRRVQPGRRPAADRHPGPLMQQLPRGGLMAVVFAVPTACESALEPYCADRVPSPRPTARRTRSFRARPRPFGHWSSVRSRRRAAPQLLTVSHAFHSPLMEPMLDEFERVAAR